MRPTAAVCALCVVVSTLPVVAKAAAQPDSAASRLSTPAPRSPWSAERSNPYSRLFETRNSLPGLRSAPVKPPSVGVLRERVIKCGMTMIPIDPAVDPGIAKTRPPTSTRFTIRAVEPSLCR